AAAGTLWWTYTAGERLLAAADARLAAYAQASAGLQLDPVADGDLETLVPLLDQALAAVTADRPGARRDEWWAILSQEGKRAAALRASLGRHLEAMLSAPLPAITLDGELVAAARANFAQVSPAQRIYSRIRPSSAAVSLPPWRPIDVVGPAGAVVFVRASGRS